MQSVVGEGMWKVSELLFANDMALVTDLSAKLKEWCLESGR